VSNPAQNPAPYSVIVRLPETDVISEESGEGEIDGTVSSLSGSAFGFSAEIPGSVAGDRQTTETGSSIAKNVSVLRTDYSASETSVSGVREVADRHFT
jgi:hypothetical protein